TSAVANGTYTVSVGDSSAQTGLPLSGDFQITGTTGTRHVTISAPGRAQVGKPFTVTATLTGGGDLTVHDVQLALSAPSGWQVSALGATEADTLSPSQGMTASWQVTVAAAAQNDVDQLTASAHYQAPNGSRPGSSTARAQVSVDPVVATTVTPPFVILPAGQGAQVQLTNTNTSGSPIHLAWTAAPPAGSQVTASPASAEEVLDPGASTTTTLTLSSSSATPATITVPINVTATVGAVTIAGPGADVQATVPYPSLAAAFNNTGITDDADHNPGNYDGVGNSFSAEALAAVGITPGSAITSGGVTFVWPDVPAGQPDNVTTQGQTISLPGSGSTLGVLGSAVNGVQNGTGTIYYTDGSTQPFSVSFQDWITRTPVDGDNLVATTAYFNRTNAGPARTPSVFAAFVPLQAGKTVQDIVLPDNVNIHSFALAIG
ncbi:MAG: hypothetical protein J2P28_24930, partial [Actinobacteria bacterium]|nr:hypothetical protein [Actinomycetota bacterium]